MCTTISDFCTLCVYRYSGGGDWVESECVLLYLISVLVFTDTLVVETGWRSECALYCSRQTTGHCVGMSYDVTTSMCALNITYQPSLTPQRLHSVLCVYTHDHYMNCS